jgi:hypothetical protein
MSWTKPKAGKFCVAGGMWTNRNLNLAYPTAWSKAGAGEKFI